MAQTGRRLFACRFRPLAGLALARRRGGRKTGQPHCAALHRIHTMDCLIFRHVFPLMIWTHVMLSTWEIILSNIKRNRRPTTKAYFEMTVKQDMPTRRTDSPYVALLSATNHQAQPEYLDTVHPNNTADILSSLWLFWHIGRISAVILSSEHLRQKAHLACKS